MSRKSEAPAKSQDPDRNDTDDIQDDNGDSWNPNCFNGKENFLATIDQFQKASSSTDPFDQPFHPTASEDEPVGRYFLLYTVEVMLN